MGDQEFYVFMNLESIWWHGTCWELTKVQRRHPDVSRSAVETIVGELRRDPSIDYSTHDPDDADDRDSPYDDDEQTIVEVSPEEFAAVRAGVVDEYELEQFRCGRCTKVIAAPR